MKLIVGCLCFCFGIVTMAYGQSCLPSVFKIVGLPSKVYAAPNEHIHLNPQVQGTGFILDAQVHGLHSGFKSVQILQDGSLSFSISAPRGSHLYHLWAKAVYGPNLVVNGDFSQGNIAFGSNYRLVGSGPWFLMDEGTYGVGPYPAQFHSEFEDFPDHSGGGGNMLVVNGNTVPGQVVWIQKIHNVQPHTKYAFSAWLASTVAENPAALSFYINNRTQRTGGLKGGRVGQWQQFFVEWDSGTTWGDVEIGIVNDNTMVKGNDFALDDISFARTCTIGQPVTLSIVEVAHITPTTCGSANGLITLSGLPRAEPIGIFIAPTGQPSKGKYMTINPRTGEAMLRDLFAGSYDLLISSSSIGRNISIRLSNVVLNDGSIALLPPVIRGPSRACTGTRLKLEVQDPNPALTYQWTHHDGRVRRASFIDLTIPDGARGDTTYTYTVTAGTGKCTSPVSVQRVLVHARLQQPVIEGPSSLCAGEKLILKIQSAPPLSSGIIYEWMLPSGIRRTQETFIEDTPPAGTYTYRVTAIDAASGCTSVIGAKQIYVREQVLQPGINWPATLCSGQRFQLIINNPQKDVIYEHRWVGGDSKTTTSGKSIENVAPDRPDTYTYRIVARKRECFVEVRQEIPVHPIPTRPTIAVQALSDRVKVRSALNVRSIDGSDILALCATEKLGLEVKNPVPGITYEWILPNGKGTRIGPSIEDVPANSGNYTYKVVAKSVEGCVSKTYEKNVYVYLAPSSQAKINVPKPDRLVLCPGEAFTLSAGTPVDGMAYEWMIRLNGMSIDQHKQASIEVKVPTKRGAHTYQVTLNTSFLNMCWYTPVSKNVRVQVISLPVIDGPDNLCSGDVLDLKVRNEEQGLTYKWILPNAGGIRDGSSIQVTSPQSGVYKVVATTAGGCSVESTKEVYIQGTPKEPVIKVLCAGDRLVAEIENPEKDVSYKWDFPAGTGSKTNISIDMPSWLEGTYQVTATANKCGMASTTAKKDIQKNRVPISRIIGPDVLCTGKKLKLSIENPIAGIQYHWKFPDGSTKLGPALEVDNPKQGDYSIIGEATSATECSFSPSTKIITVRPNPTSPSAPPRIILCGSSTVELKAEGAKNDEIYKWYDSSTGTSPLYAGIPPYKIYASTSRDATHIYTYYVSKYDTVTACESNRVEVEVHVHSRPNPPRVSSPILTACGGDVIRLEASGATTDQEYRWYTDPISREILSTNSPYEVDASETINYYVVKHDKETGCESNPAVIKVMFNGAPMPPQVSSSESTCGSGTVVLTAKGAGHNEVYKWYTSPVIDGSIVHTGLTYKPYVSKNTTYYVSKYNKDTGCESNRAAVHVAVHKQPSPPDILTPQPLCGSGTVTLQAKGAESDEGYKWYASLTSTNALATGSSYKVSVDKTISYYVSKYHTDTGCESSRVAVKVVVHDPLNPPDIPSSTSLCSSGIVTLQAQGARNDEGYKWYASLDNTDTLATGSSYKVFVDKTTSYYVSKYHTNTGCESGRARIQVQVHNRPSSPIAEALTLCGSGVVYLSVIAGNISNYRWYKDSTSTDTLGIRHGDSIDKTTSYYISKYDRRTGCESDRGEVIAVVNKRPDLPTVLPVKPICGSGTVQLEAQGAEQNESYKWYASEFLSELPLHIGPIYEPLVNYTATYYVSRYHTQTECESSRKAVTAVVNDVLPPPQVLLPKPVCGGERINLAATGAGPNEAYRWYASLSGGPLLHEGSTPFKPLLSQTTTFYVSKYNVQSHCESPRVGVKATVKSLAITSSHVRKASCHGASDGRIELEASGGSPPYSYSKDGVAQLSNLFDNLSAGKYLFQVTDKDGCKSEPVQLELTEPLPLEAKLLAVEDACYREDNGWIKVSAQGGTPPYSYQTGTQTKRSQHAVFKLPAGTHTIVIKDELGCRQTLKDVHVGEVEELMLTLTHKEDMLCEGVQKGSAELEASGGDPPYSYEVDGILQTSGSFKELGKGSHVAKAWDKKGCTAELPLEIQVLQDCNIAIPNAFSPNGDGDNDYFRPVTYGTIRRYRLEIHNRLGARLYTSTDPSQGWDGRFNGILQPEESYVWTISYADSKGKTHMQKGSVLLLK